MKAIICDNEVIEIDVRVRMKNIFNLRADMYILIVCFVYAIATPILLMGEDLGKATGEELDLNLMIIGVMATLITFLLYYVYEAFYSLLFYRLGHELAMFGLGLLIIVGYLTYLTRYLFVGTPFDRMITNIDQLNEGFVNVTVIVVVLIVLTVVSVIFGHTLGETLYRLALMYVVAIGNTMVFLYFNPLEFVPEVLLLVMNIFMIYFTLRQLARCRGLVVLNQHHYYSDKKK